MEKKSTQIVNILLLNIPIAGILCWFAQMLSVWKGEIPAFSMSQFWLNIPIAYIAATVIGLSLPCAKWGAAFALKCGAKPDTLKFGLLLNVVVNTIYTLLLAIIMTFVNVYLLAGAPLIAVVFGVIGNLIPLWLICFVISFVCAPICQKLAMKITG